MKSKKMKLSELKVESFVTGLQKSQSKTAKGGLSGVSDPIVCFAGVTQEGEPGCGPDTNYTLDGKPGCSPSIKMCLSYAGC
ncbi:MAG: pinensin family lanthipeptide [Bacteroidota bacterium]